MDQHRDVLAGDGWRDAITDWQAERVQLQNQVDDLHKILDRLHALQPEYKKLIKTTRQSLQDTYVLEREVNTFARGPGLSPIPR